jgi:hypothetical protein
VVLVLMITPPLPAATISRAAAREQRKEPVRLTAMVWFHASSGNSSTSKNPSNLFG